MNQKIKIILIIAVVLIWAFLAFILLKKDSPQTTSIKTEQPVSTSSPIVEPENPITANSNLKTYRNEEWGFEFEYPGDMTVNENIFSNYYSKFNIVLFKLTSSESHDWAVIINVVLPKFVETGFWKSQENTSKIIVDGVEGIKYEYEYDGSQYVTVILPFGEYKIILGTGDGSKPYIEELNQILSSFRFLNNE